MLVGLHCFGRVECVYDLVVWHLVGLHYSFQVFSHAHLPSPQCLASQKCVVIIGCGDFILEK